MKTVPEASRKMTTFKLQGSEKKKKKTKSLKIFEEIIEENLYNMGKEIAT